MPTERTEHVLGSSLRSSLLFIHELDTETIAHKLSKNGKVHSTQRQTLPLGESGKRHTRAWIDVAQIYAHASLAGRIGWRKWIHRHFAVVGIYATVQTPQVASHLYVSYTNQEGVTGGAGVDRLLAMIDAFEAKQRNIALAMELSSENVNANLPPDAVSPKDIQMSRDFPDRNIA